MMKVAGYQQNCPLETWSLIYEDARRGTHPLHQTATSGYRARERSMDTDAMFRAHRLSLCIGPVSHSIHITWSPWNLR